MKKFICVFICIVSIFILVGCSDQPFKKADFDKEVTEFIKNEFLVDVTIDNVEYDLNFGSCVYYCHILKPIYIEFIIRTSVHSEYILGPKHISISKSDFSNSFQTWQNDMYGTYVIINKSEEEIVQYVLSCVEEIKKVYSSIIANKYSVAPILTFGFMTSDDVLIYTHNISRTKNETREKIHELLIEKGFIKENKITI